MFSEPEPTPFDLRFQLFGFPVRVHPLFWLVSGLFCVLRPDIQLPGFVSWVLAMFLAILIHELGHAFAMRWYKMDAYIVLYAMGGLAVPRLGLSTRGLHTRPQIIISAAGPLAGMAVAYLVALALIAGGLEVRFDAFFHTVPRVTDLGRAQLQAFINDFCGIGVAWGMINLLPVYPLDGGHISRELFLAASPHRGIERSLMLSIVAGVGMAVFAAITWRSVYAAILFGVLAFQSYQLLEAYRRGGRW